MADPRPTLTVQPSRKPSFLNSKAALGLIIGGMASGALPFAGLIGLGVGAWLGKRQMQREQVVGKQVSPPSGWNLGTLFGGIGGFNVGLAAAGVTALAISTGGIGLVGWLGIAGVASACTAIGGKIGKQFQKRQYAAAENYVMQHGEFGAPQQPQAGIPQPMQAMGQTQGVPQQAQGAGLNAARQQMDPQQLAQLQALAAQGQRMAPPQAESMTDKLAHTRTTGPQER